MILVCGILGAALTAASAEPARLESGSVPSGPAKTAIEAWFVSSRGMACTDRTGAEGACGLDRVVAVRTFYASDGITALVFVLYSPHVANIVHQVIGQLRRTGEAWALVGEIRGVTGEGPESLSFEDGRASFTMAAAFTGDARCCLTGRQSYEVDLATGAVKAGPKLPGRPSNQSSAPIQAGPRPEDYRGATYLHNGSQVLVDERAGTITYEVPKASIRKSVPKGTLLFQGSFKGSGLIEGTAYVFKAGCAPAPYPVAGLSKGSMITLKGSAPHRDPHSCAVTVKGGSAHSTLRFVEYGDF